MYVKVFVKVFSKIKACPENRPNDALPAGNSVRNSLIECRGENFPFAAARFRAEK
jgi:hypothetical protein